MNVNSYYEKPKKIKKKNFKIYAECIKEHSSILTKLGEKVYIGTIVCKSNAMNCLMALEIVYRPENWKLTMH